MSFIDQTIASRYHIKAEIGRGGYGCVYLAKDEKSPKHVAVKILPIRNGRSFKQETRALAALRHQSIVKLMDVIVEEDRLFLVMEYVQGRTLDTILKEKKFDWQHGLKIGLSISDALAYAHQRGILHRDIQPKNIMQDENDGSFKLLDFGLASLEGMDYLNGKIIGTPAYIAPEQFESNIAHVNETADLYGLGCILYILITGEQPYDSHTIEKLMELKKEFPKKSLTDLNVPVEVKELILSLLDPNPSKRYPSAEAVSNHIQAILHAAQNSEKLPKPQNKIQAIIGSPEKYPLVGRKKALNEFEELLVQAKKGRGSCLLVYGQSGSGKSRLIRHFLKMADEENFITGFGNTLEMARLRNYYAFQELFESLVTNLKTKNQKNDLIVQIKESLAHDIHFIREAFPPMCQILGGRDRQIKVNEDSLLSAVPKIFKPLGPCVLWLDDLQWADSSTLNLFSHLAQQITNLPLIIIASTRSENKEYVDYIGSKMAEPITKIETLPLKEADIQKLLSKLSPSSHPSSDLVSDLTRFSQGLPLLVWEGFRKLAKEGLLTATPNGFILQDDQKCRQALSSVSSTQLLVSRLKNLSDLSFEFLKAASIFGRKFNPHLVQILLNKDVDIAPFLQELQEEAMISLEFDGSLSFTHDRIQEAAYRELSPALKHSYHLEAIKILADKQPDTYPFLAVEHFEKAGEYAQAYEQAVKVAMQAQQQKTNQIALSFLMRALGWIDQSKVVVSAHEIKKLQAMEAELTATTGNYQRAETLLRNMLDKESDKSVRADLLSELGHLYFRKGDVAESLNMHLEALRQMGFAIPKNKFLFFLYSLSHISIYIAKSLSPFKPKIKKNSKKPLTRILDRFYDYSWAALYVHPIRGLIANIVAVNLAVQVGPSKAKAMTFAWHAVFLTSIPLLKWAQHYIKEAKKMAGQINDKAATQVNHLSAACYYYASAEWDKTLKELSEGENYFPEVQDRFIFGSLIHVKPFIYWRRGEYEKTLQGLRRAELNYQAIQDVRGLGNVYAYQTEIYLELGQINQAKRCLENLKKYAKASHDTINLCCYYSSATRLNLYEGDVKSAIRQADQGMAYAIKVGQRSPWVATLPLNRLRAWNSFYKKEPSLKTTYKLTRAFASCLANSFIYRGFRAEALAAMAETAQLLNWKSLANFLAQKAIKASHRFKTPVGEILALQILEKLDPTQNLAAKRLDLAKTIGSFGLTDTSYPQQTVPNTQSYQIKTTTTLGYKNP